MAYSHFKNYALYMHYSCTFLVPNAFLQIQYVIHLEWRP